MKTLFLLFGLFLVTNVYTQTSQCDCTEPLNKDLNSKYSETKLLSLQDELYKFYQLTKKESNRKRKDFGLSNEASAMTGYGYFESRLSANYSSRKSKYKAIDEKIELDKKINLNTFKEILTDEFSKNQLEGYKECLNLCKTLNANGVFYEIRGDSDDVFAINLHFRNIVGRDSVTLSNDADYINCQPIGMNKFTKGVSIKNNQSITQYLKVVDKEKTAQIGVDFEKIAFSPIVIDSYGSGDSMPIGTIISSVLNYNQFLQINKLKRTEKMSRAIWVPCDGRNVGSSDYGEIAGSVPDLRGLFLRNVNDYEESFPGVDKVSNNRMNPERTNAGVFQPDAFQGHKHFDPEKAPAYIGVKNTDWDKEVANAATTSEESEGKFSSSDEFGEPRISSETRPKNMTVYYYIKINR